MSSAAPSLLSEEEFLSLPESGDKLELIDGEVISSPSPSYRHQVILRRLVRALEDWARDQGLDASIGMAPLDVRFAPDRILQPDAFVSLAPLPLDHEGPVTRMPELCVEVLSSQRAYDRITKRAIYGEAGVRELWTVEPDGTVERWSGDRLSERESVSAILTSPWLPGFSLDTRTLVAG